MARMIVIALTAIGAVVWLAGLATLHRVGRERRAAADDMADQYDTDTTAGAERIVGSAEVAGSPDDLAAKLAAGLARGAMEALGPVKVLAQSRHEVVFESAGSSAGGAAHASTLLRRGRVRFAGSGLRTRIDYAVETGSRSIILALGWVFIALGFAALVAVPALQFRYVIPNPNAAIRAQAVQTIQMCHLLWPPFLFAFLARQPGRVIRAQMDALVHNLPYT